MVTFLLDILEMLLFASSCLIFIINEGRNVELVFIFNPKQNFQNITVIWMSIIAFSNYPAYPKIFDIVLNDEVTITAPEIFYADSQVSAVSIDINSTVYSAMIESINKMTFENPRYIGDYGVVDVAQMGIFKVTLFIEYEYQAR